MRHISSFCMVLLMLCTLNLNSQAQVGRIFGMRQLQLDDGSGNTITIQTPAGGWLGNANFSLPLPPYPGGPSGWIAPGTLDGQIPVWSVALNSWQPVAPSLALNFAGNDEPFLTFSAATNLTNSRILNSGLGISLIQSGGFPNGSFTVSNTGVLSNVAGTGISVSGATGDVTIANTGVLSTTAGSGISVSGPTGDVQITNTGVIQLLGTPNEVLVNGFGSIGQTGMIQLSTPQDIAPTSSPTFSGLTLTGKGTSASTVTGDVGTTLITKDFVTTPGNVAVLTNASLVGDGTVGNPLGLNLSNSNTWTADQLVPSTGTQGNNLISAVNAGTAGSVNAVQIGAGLTDAQVNDNLTINGGTIDNSPIGANTASSGAFTTLGANSTVNFSALSNGSSATDIIMSNGGTLETRTISSLGGMIAVNTNASLVGDGTVGNPLGLNLSNSNTWTADQLLPNSGTQGNNLISAVNAGTAGSVNAVQIGAGLTDAQVNDNLTINGGTIDNSPIGANTASSGAFTTLGANSLTLTGKGSSASTLSNDPGTTLVTLDYVQTPGNIAVLVDATLLGDGSGTPLGLNTAHSNTFSAPQFLLLDPSQGDNLIASVNTSSNTINSVNIGNGLTDGQVNDDLTINGGAIDNSPIGANTANTGAFTTLGANNTVTFSALSSGSSATDIVMSNGGVLETRTIASLNNLLSISTDATLIGNGTGGNPLGMNLSNSNTWEANQILPASAAQGDNLISAVNASANTINAVNIGTGLTDAQVNNNLTINGGTIDNSPIGNTTRSTGNFTVIDANAPANAIGDGASDVAMLTVRGLDLGTATGNHLLVEGNAHVTQKLTVSGTISASSIDNTPIGGGVRSTGAFTTLDANNGLTVSNNKELTLTGAVNNKYATSNLAAAYGLGPQDYILVCTNAGAGNVNLPANPPAGRTYIVKSMGAGNVNIVPANGAVTIDGVVGNYVITGGLTSCVTLVCDGTNWFVLTK